MHKQTYLTVFFQAFRSLAATSDPLRRFKRGLVAYQYRFDGFIAYFGVLFGIVAIAAFALGMAKLLGGKTLAVQFEALGFLTIAAHGLFPVSGRSR